MLSDLNHYNLLTLALADNWSDERKEQLMEKFEIALTGFLTERLRSYFDDQANAEFEQVMQNPSVSEEQITSFYCKYIPHFQETTAQLVLEFKKMFLVLTYENKLKEVQGTPEEKTWQNILNAAKADYWDNVAGILQTR